MYHGYIYLTTNQRDNKIYVGQKSKSPEKSKSYYGSGNIILDIIEKHGTYFLKKIILGEIFSDNLEDFKQQLNEAETECIYFFRAYGSDGENRDFIYGYNLTKEGGSCLGRIPTEESRKKSSNSNKKRLKENPEIVEQGRITHKKTLEDNPDIMKNAGATGSKTKKENPEIMENTKIKLIKYNRENPEEVFKRSQKVSKTMVKNKTTVGNNHPSYKALDYEFLIKEYFNIDSTTNIVFNYNQKHTIHITINAYKRFLKVLNLPVNYINIFKPELKKIYINFVEENKYKINFFIDECFNLEKIYFENKWRKKYEGDKHEE